MASAKNGDSVQVSWKVLFVFLYFLFLWAIVASLWQGGWAGFGALVKVYGVVAIASVVVSDLYKHLRQGLVTFLGAAGFLIVVVWIWWLADSWSERLWDLGAAGLAIGVTALLMEGYSRSRQAAAPALADLLVFVVLFWIFASCGVALRSRPLATDPGRFAQLGPERSIVPEDATRWDGLRVGLALSGGGYRAAVFHAGVLQALEELGIRVDNLSTVSGGSIVGAFYAVGGDPRDFVDAVAAGRFNLKRSLMQAHNALRLPLPMKLPGLETRLFPWCSFDRLDVQEQLLRNLLFEGAGLQVGGRGNAGVSGGPLLMIAVTDLTYGFQLGLLPDGFLKLGHNGRWEVYRNNVVEVSEELDLAERVAVSGAFPLAFPPRRLTVRVDPVGATGRGTRELLLTDGGIRDNSGHDLLRAADALSRKPGDPDSVADHGMPEEWDLDAMLASDAGAVFGVLEAPGGALSLLPRTFDVAAVEADGAGLPSDRCETLPLLPTRFSPALHVLEPDTQFNLKNDTVRRAALERESSFQFDPGRYQEQVLRRLTEQLPGPGGERVRAKLDELLALWGDHRVDDREWARAIRAARVPGACEPGRSRRPRAEPLVPGVCEALELRALVIEAIEPDLATFRATSTLDDTPSPETVEALERLGRTLVYLRWPLLSRNLDLALECKERPPTADEGGPPSGPSPVRW